jgi:hypothetical protein
MKYAGIGARKTPGETLELMRQYGVYLSALGWVLRSGKAWGADAAFQAGANNATWPSMELYGRNEAAANPAWVNHAAMFHPKWEECSPVAKLLLGRNSAIILGPNLTEPVNAVICWTPGGRVIGGTGQSLRIAAAYGVPVFNLAIAGQQEALNAFVANAK